jgi:hypothetical protein
MSDARFPLTRRQFGLSLGAPALGIGAAAASAEFQGMPWADPAVVHRVYLATTNITWPRPDIDLNQEKAGIEARLAEIERRHAAMVRFSGGEILRVGDNVKAWAGGLGDADAVLVIDLTSGLGGMMRELREVQTPMLLFARPYSGWAYVDVATWRTAGKRVDLISSSDWGDLDPFMPLFRTIRHLKKSKVIIVRSGEGGSEQAAAFTRQFGTEIRFMPYAELKSAYDSVEARKAKQEADAFTAGALRVVEPSPQEITDSLRFYLAVREVLKREKANAMAIDCLGGFRRRELPAYPCVAWSKLNDEGLYGVCEADLPSTMTQLLVTSFSGKPGFVTDPVFDTGKNEIIHAHCVSATCLEGIHGAASPYVIRSHMEDNKGVSMQVLAPISGTVTVGKFAGPQKFLISTGEVCGNVDDPRGCRTKFRTRVANAQKMLENYSAGLHRVVFWGDHTRAVARLGRFLGYQVVEEM